MKLGNALDSQWLAGNSLYVESVLKHAFLYDLARVLLLEETPRKVTVLNAEVDDAGVDMVLTCGSITRHVQMKTLNKKRAPNPYAISASLFQLPGGCVIWTCYDPKTMLPSFYHVLCGQGNGNIPGADRFPPASRKRNGERVDRDGYLAVKTSDANHHCLTIEELAITLFGKSLEVQ